MRLADGAANTQQNEMTVEGCVEVAPVEGVCGGEGEWEMEENKTKTSC